MRKSIICLFLAILFTASFLAWGALRIVSVVKFDHGCTAYIKHAADANTVEMASEELSKAITYAEQHGYTEGIVSIFFKNPKNDVGFWYKNMCSSYNELQALPEDSTPLERTNVLMKLRESLTDQDDNGTNVTLPSGIEIYPRNAPYFWWAVASFILAFVFWYLLPVARDSDNRRERERYYNMRSRAI